MERFIAGLVERFEAGRITRRQFCEAVALAASVCATGESAKAAPARGLKMLGVNHVSYSCADYRKARDFYASVMGMQILNDNGKDRANLAFGPEPGNGGQFVVARNFGNGPQQPGRSAVDHVCYTMSNWNEQRIRAALKAAGSNPVSRADGNSINIFDPYNYQVQLASVVGGNPWKA